MPLFINNKKIIVPFNSLSTVGELIESICKESGMPLDDSYSLNFNGLALDVDDTLQKLGIKDKSHLIFESQKFKCYDIDSLSNSSGKNNSKVIAIPPSSSSSSSTTTSTNNNNNNNNNNIGSIVSPFDVSANKVKALSHKRVFKEYQSLLEQVNSDPSLPFRVYLKENSLALWNIIIKGPVDSPYQDGLFVVLLQFPDDYPFRPMSIRFLTKIYHINISDVNGKVCLDILKSNSSITVKLVIESLISLLSSPNKDDSFEDDKAKLYNDDISKFMKNAKDWTSLYAKYGLEELKKIHSLD